MNVNIIIGVKYDIRYNDNENNFCVDAFNCDFGYALARHDARGQALTQEVRFARRWQVGVPCSHVKLSFFWGRRVMTGMLTTIRHVLVAVYGETKQGVAHMSHCMKKIASVVALFALVSPSAFAERDVTVSAGLGTTGISLYASIPIIDSVKGRFGMNYFQANVNSSSSGVDYKFKATLNTFDALVDYYPTKSGFRVTGGVVYNGNLVNAKAKPDSGSFTFNGSVYDAADAGQIKGKIKFSNAAPYLGVGWGQAAGKGWNFSADLGVIFQGRASVSLKSKDCRFVAPICDRLAADIEVERANLKHDMKGFEYYPVIRVGVSYSF